MNVKLPHRLLAPLALLLVAALPASAAERILDVAPGDLKVTFVLEASTHTVHGSFVSKGGTIRFDPATGAASGRLALDATSGETGNEKRDKKMHEKVLESALFPEAAFEVQRIEGSLAGTGERDLTMHGVVDVHGTRHELAVPARVEVEAEGARGTATMDIPFVEWGLVDPSFMMFRVEKVVHVTIGVSGALRDVP